MKTGYVLVASLILFLGFTLLGCSSNRSAYFGQSDRSVHVMEDRIYNPADFRHERHNSGIESHTND